ncbi:hypothetical protein SKAU_G00375360 [Synaphobranchus kaupii]|uniref:Uncharacterized protein n=1 Tax=Synaphobranchus kaupii TaxID=118154 RepID=A0A9Q1EGX7_SYNKA|nr:hypothetical protein SKAU_G00375360 [Synaphobranchus kaupii]
MVLESGRVGRGKQHHARERRASLKGLNIEEAAMTSPLLASPEKGNRRTVLRRIYHRHRFGNKLGKVGWEHVHEIGHLPACLPGTNLHTGASGLSRGVKVVTLKVVFRVADFGRQETEGEVTGEAGRRRTGVARVTDWPRGKSGKLQKSEA